jgi:hypothetical protein
VQREAGRCVPQSGGWRNRRTPPRTVPPTGIRSRSDRAIRVRAVPDARPMDHATARSRKPDESLLDRDPLRRLMLLAGTGRGKMSGGAPAPGADLVSEHAFRDAPLLYLHCSRSLVTLGVVHCALCSEKINPEGTATDQEPATPTADLVVPYPTPPALESLGSGSGSGLRDYEIVWSACLMDDRRNRRTRTYHAQIIKINHKF